MAVILLPDRQAVKAVFKNGLREGIDKGPGLCHNKKINERLPENIKNGSSGLPVFTASDDGGSFHARLFLIVLHDRRPDKGFQKKEGAGAVKRAGEALDRAGKSG